MEKKKHDAFWINKAKLEDWREEKIKQKKIVKTVEVLNYVQLRDRLNGFRLWSEI